MVTTTDWRRNASYDVTSGEQKEDGSNRIECSSKRDAKGRETRISKLSGRQSAVILKFVVEGW